MKRMLLVAPTLVACAGAPQEPAPGPPLVSADLSECNVYGHFQEPFQYCLMISAARLQSPARASLACDQAGPWAARCRQRWVSAATTASRQTRLQMCGSDSECAFEVLEDDPPSDVSERMEMCEQFAPDHTWHCVGHALNVWAARPDLTAAQVNEMIARPTAWGERVGTYTGLVVFCRGLGACGDSPDVTPRCKSMVKELTQTPSKCLQMLDNARKGFGKQPPSEWR